MCVHARQYSTRAGLVLHVFSMRKPVHSSLRMPSLCVCMSDPAAFLYGDVQHNKPRSSCLRFSGFTQGTQSRETNTVPAKKEAEKSTRMDSKTAAPRGSSVVCSDPVKRHACTDQRA